MFPQRCARLTFSFARFKSPNAITYRKIMSQSTTGAFIFKNLRMTTALVDFGGVSSRRRYASKADSTLSEFLKTEIEAEKKMAKENADAAAAAASDAAAIATAAAGGEQPSFSGFHLASDQREFVLTKKQGEETITVTVNVNDSVVSEDTSRSDSDIDASSQGKVSKLFSKPDFTVKISKGDRTVVLSCCYAGQAEADENGSGDSFELDEIYTYKGDAVKDPKYYVVAADILDGKLYDHLKTFLKERGIDKDFVQRLCQFSTYYEQNEYIKLLQDLQDFFAH